IKDLSTITGFRQVARLYSLRYGVGKAFNKNNKAGNITNTLQNLIIQHADAQTFLKHYLSRHVNIDI
ncbi:hypothetical protein V2W45_1254834, partial [Cenococcum geophilum]